MIKNKIGENAGKVWAVHNDNKEMNIIKLKKLANLNDKDLFLALGWLSKENKVLFGGDKSNYKICLTEN
jgi:hypothetical protein